MRINIEELLKAAEVQDFRTRYAAVVDPMLALFPDCEVDPAPIATRAVYAFIEGRAEADLSGRMKASRVYREQTWRAIAESAARIEEAYQAMPAYDWAEMTTRLEDEGVDLEQFGRALAVLHGIADEDPVKLKLGRDHDHDTVGAVRAAQYLMREGFTRKRAAKVVETLTQNIPDPEVKAKSQGVIEQAVRRAEGVSNKPKKAPIWLTPRS